VAHAHHHALSSIKHWGGTVTDYLPLHQHFDSSKALLADYRHRALYHHAAGIALMDQVFGATLTLSSDRVIPTRWVGEQHVREDLGRIPSFADWAREIRPQPWMGRAGRLDLDDDPRPRPKRPCHYAPAVARAGDQTFTAEVFEIVAGVTAPVPVWTLPGFVSETHARHAAAQEAARRKRDEEARP
jgi:hypothetical protein